MNFAQRLVAVRKERGMTQQTLADQVGVHVTQIRRYEAGTSQPTLDVLRALAVGLSVTTDALVFNEDERDPESNDLRLHLEALNQLDDEKATHRQPHRIHPAAPPIPQAGAHRLNKRYS
jgi:transcriptional regulator with XRE-family HTH domain